jgi:hypothetical protein
MRSVALKLGLFMFATLLGWTCGESAAQQSVAGDRQYPNATTCTRLRSVCLSSQADCGFNAGPGALPWRDSRDLRIATNGEPYCVKLCNFRWEHCMQTGWWAGRLTRPAERR